MTSTTSVTKRNRIGIILIVIAGVFMPTGMFSLSRAMSIVDYGETSVPGTGCDSCQFGREFLLMWFAIFGATGGVFAAVGVWVTLKGLGGGRGKQA